MVDNKSYSLFDFGRMANQYDHWYNTQIGQRHDRIQKDLVRDLLPEASQGDQLLDVGCGTGHWSFFFAMLGYSVVGIDISAEMIEMAQQKNKNRCRFEIADAENIPFGDDSFEVISAMTTLEFLRYPKTALTEMTRCLKPGSCIIIGTLNKLAPLNRRRVAQSKEPYTSANLFSKRDLRKLLAQFGNVSLIVSTFPPSLWQRIVHRLTGAKGAFIVAELRP